jgi:hypothetical protein
LQSSAAAAKSFATSPRREWLRQAAWHAHAAFDSNHTVLIDKESHHE